MLIVAKKFPNVVLIQADQFRWDCIGALNDDVLSPNLDSLVDEGSLFTNSFCPLPVCTPSRYSLLSGTTPHEHGALSNHSTPSATIPMLPRILSELGYESVAVGKMHFTPAYHDVGFTRMKLAEQNGAGRYWDDYHEDLHNEGLLPYDDLIDQEIEFRSEAPDEYWETFGAMSSQLPEAWHSTTWIGDNAVEEVRGWDQDVPHFLHISFIKPHHPFDPPESWLSHFDEQTLSIPAGWTDSIPPQDENYTHAYFDNSRLDMGSLRRVLAHYYASIAQLDAQVGRVIDALKQKSIYEDTLIVFTSDHGEYLGFHHLLLKSGPMYDPLVRVPLIIKWNGGQSGEIQTDNLISLTDLAPTILGRIGVEPPSSMSGRNLANSDPREYLFAESGPDHGLEYMVRTERYKLLIRGESEMLFDLDSDPFELDNLAGSSSHSDLKRQLRDALLQWFLFETPAPRQLREEAASIASGRTAIDADRRKRQTKERFEEEVKRSKES